MARATDASIKLLTAALSGGDRRSVGQADRMAASMRRDPRLLEAARLLVEESRDPVVRLRAADAIEKASRAKRLPPDWSRNVVSWCQDRQPEVRWHAAQLAARLPWTDAQRRPLMRCLRAMLADPSRIVRVSALQAIVDLAEEPVARRLAESALSDESPAVRARARSILAQKAGVPTRNP